MRPFHGLRPRAVPRDETKLAALASKLDSVGVAHHLVPAFVRDPDQVAAVVDTAWERFGRLDIVVNNAGGQFSSPALDISPKGWHAVVETNLYGTWFTMQAAARRWVAEATPGSIINIATIIGRGSAGTVHTAAARAGAINASQYLAVEWAPHRIRVKPIAVGVVASEGLQHYPATARTSFGHNPMRHLGDVWDVAQGVASPARLQPSSPAPHWK